MRKFSLFMLMAVGLLISGNLWANVPQVKESAPAPMHPQPYQWDNQQQTPNRAAKMTTAAVTLTTDPLTDDQVVLKKGGEEIGTFSIVAAFHKINSDDFTAEDSATIILQKNIDLAKEDYYTTGNSYYGVVLNANRKAVLDLNGFNFKSAIQTGSASGANDGKTSALIYNKGILYLTDHTFDYASIKDADPATITFDASSLCFFDESADTRQSPSYASNVVLNNGDLTIRGCKLSDTSYGSACYCVDQQTCSRDSITLWVEYGFICGRNTTGGGTAVRQYFTNSTCRSKFVMNDGVFYAGKTCIWTQFNKNVDPKCEVYFSGGKCFAPNWYAYYNYPHGNNSTKDCSYNFSGTEFNSLWGNFLYSGSKDKEGEGTTINIYGGKNIGYYAYDLYTHYATINVYDGTFNDTYFYCEGHHNSLNIMGGEFNNSYIYESDYDKPSDGTKNIWNISNGKFNDTYIYLSDVKSSTYNISGGIFTGDYSIYTESSVSNCTFNLSDGTFGGDIADYGSKDTINVTGGLYRSDIYTFGTESTIAITGGYYAYGKAEHERGYSPDEDLYWLSYVNSDYDAIINGTGKEDMKPWIIDEDESYYYKIDKKTRKELEIPEDAEPDPENPGNKKVEWGEEGVSGTTQGQGSTDPEQVVKEDNLVVPGNTTLVITEGTTAEVKNLVLGQDAVVVVEPGAKMNVGDNGVEIEPEADNVKVIVKGGGQMEVGAEGFDPEAQLEVRSDANGNGAFYVSPNADASTLNNVIVKLFVKKAHKKLKDDADQFVGNEQYDYYWQHIAIPTKGKPNFSNDRECTSFIYRLDPRIGEWEELTSLDQFNEPFRGYMICPNRTEDDGVTYTFTGDIIGNGDQSFHFKNKGYNFFGNSYTAPIDVQTLVDNIGQDVELTVWIYDVESSNYIESNNLMRVLGKAKFDKISSMQGFFMRIRGDEYGVDGGIDYADAVWKNRILTNNPMIKSPKRAALQLDYSLATLSFATANHEDQVILVEGNEFTNDFDNGNDASKMKGEGVFNVFANTVAGELACVATNELEGTMIAFNAGNEREYTVTFNDIAGEEYALVDLVTGMKIEMTDGVSYTFTAEPNSVCEARFMISSSQKSPTAMGNISTMQKVNGIYTLLGAYVGKTADWHILPAGVYVIDGHKVIK